MSFWKYTLQIYGRLGTCLQYCMNDINKRLGHKPRVKAQPIYWFGLKFVENNEQPDVDRLHIWYRKRVFEMRETGAIFPISSIFLGLHAGTHGIKMSNSPPKKQIQCQVVTVSTNKMGIQGNYQDAFQKLSTVFTLVKSFKGHKLCSSLPLWLLHCTLNMQKKTWGFADILSLLFWNLGF